MSNSYFDALLKETTDVLAVWYKWEALFDHPQDQLDRIGQAGNLLFGSIERVFYRDVVLGICRLTDPEFQKGHQNISISHFQSAAYETDSRLQELVKDADAKTLGLRNWRSKRIAHLDAETGIGWRPPLGCGRQEVSDALHAIQLVLCHVSKRYHDFPLLLDCLKPQISGPINKTISYILHERIQK